MVSTADKNIKNLETAMHYISAFLRATCRVNATGKIVQNQDYPALLVKLGTLPAANVLCRELNARAANLELRGIPLGEIAQTEEGYGNNGPMVVIRGNTDVVVEIAERLQLAHA